MYLTDLFSVRLIFLTLFAPWKRDQVSDRGLPLNEKFQVWIWNLISRFVGFLVKSIVFLVYLMFVSIFFALAFVSILFWFLLPIIIIGLMIGGIIELLTH